MVGFSFVRIVRNSTWKSPSHFMRFFYMRVVVREVGAGLHPSEVVVEVQTIDGPVRLVVDKRSVDDEKSLDVGRPLQIRGEEMLVELPRETTNGLWRVWVNVAHLLQSKRAEKVA